MASCHQGFWQGMAEIREVGTMQKHFVYIHISHIDTDDVLVMCVATSQHDKQHVTPLTDADNGWQHHATEVDSIDWRELIVQASSNCVQDCQKHNERPLCL